MQFRTLNKIILPTKVKNQQNLLFNNNIYLQYTLYNLEKVRATIIIIKGCIC